MQRFFFDLGIKSHNQVLEYSRRRFTYIFKEPVDARNSRKDLQVYSQGVESEFIEYIDKLVYNACSGDAAQITALEKKETFIEFLSFCNNYLEKVDRINKQNEKLNQK